MAHFHQRVWSVQSANVWHRSRFHRQKWAWGLVADSWGSGASREIRHLDYLQLRRLTDYSTLMFQHLLQSISHISCYCFMLFIQLTSLFKWRRRISVLVELHSTMSLQPDTLGGKASCNWAGPNRTFTWHAEACWVQSVPASGNVP